MKMPPITHENLEAMRDWGIADTRLEQIKQAYLWMEKFYRPEAPSDGFGNIMLSKDEITNPIRLEMEAWIAAHKWYEEDQKMEFTVTGCAEGSNAAAMYLILQAAQLCCSGVEPRIRRILELAIKALPG